MSLLLSTTMKDLVVSKRGLIDVAASTPVGEVLELLDGHQILSVPVFGSPGSWLGAGGTEIVVGDKQYIGIISVLDLVVFIMYSVSGSMTDAQADANIQRAQARPVFEAFGSTDESLSFWAEVESQELVSMM